MKTITHKTIKIPQLKTSPYVFVTKICGYDKYNNGYKKDVDNGRFHLFFTGESNIEIHFDLYLNNGNHFVLPSLTVL